jgi:sigma-B regulation protein RsbU (phosphoserine phosphatase)
MRTYCTAGLSDLATTMRSVNQLVYESTAPQHFVTLFVAKYDDVSRQLQYVNCGHNPPILLRRSGTVEHLFATASVLGAFADWDCSVQELVMEFGDTLLLFTDGVTEAANKDGEEFGEERLIVAISDHIRQTAVQALDALTHVVQEFGGKDQADDLTMIVAHIVEPSCIETPDVKATDHQRGRVQATWSG